LQFASPEVQFASPELQFASPELQFASSELQFACPELQFASPEFTQWYEKITYQSFGVDKCGFQYEPMCPKIVPQNDKF
jgi:hypothetical protein